MAFTISNTSATQSTLTQSGTDTTWNTIETAVTAVPIVARSTNYVVGNIIRPTVATGFLYRCTVAGTTMAAEPQFGTTAGGTTADGTASFFAFTAPIITSNGDRKTYHCPTYDVVISGTLTIANPMTETITCRRWTTTSTAIYTSGSFMLDGVTPKFDGTHFTTAMKGANDFQEVSNWDGTWNIRGGVIQLAASIKPDGTLSQKFFNVTFTSSALWARSIRFRSFATQMEFLNECRFYNIALDAFRIPLVMSVKGFASEYVSEYVGSSAGGTDSKMTIFALSNQDGQFDFDNYGGGFIEIYNCAKGAALDIRSLNNDSRHCVPLLQQLNFKITNLAGVVRDGVKFICTDIPTNSPTTTITTVSPFKLWDFRNPQVYTGITTGGGLVSSTPVLKVWYGSTNIQNLRFPASTAVYRFAGYNVIQQDISVILGSDTPQNISVAMTAATNLTLTQTQASALTGIALVASGATGGTVTVTSPRTLSELWQYFRAWKPDNLTSNDSWTFDGATLNVGAWTVSGLENITGGELVVSSATASGAINNLQIVGNVIQSGVKNLTNVNITGTLSYNTATTSQFTFTNCILQNVSNSGAGIVTIKRVNSTLIAGTNIIAYTPTTLNLTLNGGRIRILDNLSVEQFNQTSDGIFELPANATGLWTYKIAKYGSQVIQNSLTIDGTIKIITASYIPDNSVVANLATVTAYTVLDTTQKIYDFYSLYLSGVVGITTTKIVFLTPTLLDLGSFKIENITLGVSTNVIGINSSILNGVNVTTTNTQIGVLPTYPQQIKDAVGTTNWLKVNLTAGQVIQDSFNNTFTTISYTTLIPASFTSAVNLFVTQRGFKKQVINIPYTLNLFPLQSYTLIPDSNVMDTVTDFISATLTNSQNIYDAFSQYQASSIGILDTYTLTKAPGSVDFISKGFELTTINDFTVNPIKIKTTNLTADTYYSTSNFTQGLATLGSDVKIRALNLNSELVYNTDSVTFYPTVIDRDAGTNPGITTSGGIYRYKFGSVYTGVTMTNPTNIRYTTGTTISLGSLPLVTGNYIFSLTPTELIIQTNNNLRLVNQNVIKTSLFIPASQLF